MLSDLVFTSFLLECFSCNKKVKSKNVEEKNKYGHWWCHEWYQCMVSSWRKWQYMDDNLNEPVGKANYEDDRHEIADPSKEKEGESTQ